MKDWNNNFMELSKHIALWSKDVNTKTGAVIVDRNNRILSVGYNGFPSGCNDEVMSRYERPQKYLWTEHAERNAIYSAVRNGISLMDAIIYVMWFPCADCARAIIQSGISKIVCYEPNLNDQKWGEHFKVALEMFNECGVEIVFLT